MPATITIELLLGWLYLVLRKKPKLLTITLIACANALTQWGLGIALTTFLPSSYWPGLMVSEVIILLLEAAILHFPQRENMPFKEALLLSFLINAVSFGIGLLLPV
jgi:hypothetical protein